MNKICIYLRKSRSDEELEKNIGEGETLRRHKTALLKFAKEKKLNIVEIKEEIVSGDSLYFRPKMLELLKEIEEKKYTGVLCMDIDRLSRGAMKDQGIILEAFKENKVKIITPLKTYDLEDEYDEEMTEFKTFFARRELKTINRRMQGGRVRSIEEGNYIATNAPFGYDIEYINKSRTLKINEYESTYVKKIFDWYINGDGCSSIADKLNSLGVKTKIGNKFSRSSVLLILKNQIYIGKVTWKKKDIRKSKTPGKVKDTKTRDKSEWIIADGKHKPIIDIDIFNTAAKILEGKYHIPYQLMNKPVNPVAGLATCSICNKKMVMRKLRGVNRLLCINKCKNKSIRYDIFEEQLLESLENYYRELEFNISLENDTNNSKDSNLLENLKKELIKSNKQKDSLFDFLERGIYTEEIFISRLELLNGRIKTIEEEILKLEKDSSKNKIDEELVFHFKNIIEAYRLTSDITLKNRLLKTILTKIEYYRDASNTSDSLDLKLYIKELH